MVVEARTIHGDNMDLNQEVTLTNKKGEIRRVKRSELAQYGLPTDYISQADTYAESVKKGVLKPETIPETFRAATLQSLSSSGYTPKSQIEVDAENKKALLKPDAEAVYGGIENLKQQAQDTNIGDVILSKITGGNLGYKADTFDQSRKLLGQTVASLFEKGRLSDKDRDFYQKEIVNVGALGSTDAINAKLNNLETEILRKAGYSPKDFGGFKDPKADDKPWFPNFINSVRENPVVKTALGGGLNVMQDAGVAAGTNDPQLQASQAALTDTIDKLQTAILSSKDPAEKQRLRLQLQRSYDTLRSTNADQTNGYSEDIGRNYASRGLQTGAEVAATTDIASHPIETVKAPFNLIKGATKAVLNPVESFNAVKAVAQNPKAVVDAGKEFLKQDRARTGKLESSFNLPKMPKPNLRKGAENATELVTGGGTKDFVAGNVNLDNAQTMSEELLKHDIFSSPSTKGRIVRTQQALTDEGKNLEKVFTSSPKKVSGREIADSLQQYLESKYGKDQRDAINSVINKITSQGKYDITKNDTELNMNDIWTLAKNAKDFESKAFNLPNNGPLLKDLSKETERFLRDKLYTAVPEATPHLRSYRALRTYMDNILEDPSGLNVKDLSSLTKFLSGKLEAVVTYPSQKLYNMAPKATEAAPVAKTVEKTTQAFNPFAEFAATKTGNKTPLADAVPPAPSERTIRRDMRYKQGNFTPRSTSR